MGASTLNKTKITLKSIEARFCSGNNKFHDINSSPLVREHNVRNKKLERIQNQTFGLIDLSKKKTERNYRRFSSVEKQKILE